QTGAANPFNGINVAGDISYAAKPVLADVNGDGTLDLLVGDGYGALHYYENTGTKTSPDYVEQTGAANPFGGINVGNNASPAFGDVDGDGTLDLVVGAADGTLHYYENTGTKTNPHYVEQTGIANPFYGINDGYYASPTLGDINGDGVLDVA